MEERYRLQDRRTGANVEVRGFPLELEGDPDLCRRVRDYLRQPVTAFGASFNPEGADRGTRVVSLAAGQPGWLKTCLRRAAEELALRLTEVPLSES
jgi:hypothetical protein